MSTPAFDAKVTPGVAFRYRDFRLFQAARFLSILAIQMQSVAVGWQVYSLTHRAIDLGYVGLMQFLPGVGLSLVTGHVADRFDRRKVVLACHLATLACSAMLMGLSWHESHAGTHVPLSLYLGSVYGVLFAFGAARAFYGPASSALMPQLVSDAHFSNAVAWSSSVWQLATVLGPMVGGFIYGATKAAFSVYAASAVLTLCAFALTLTMRVRTGRMESAAASWRTVLAGVRYVWGKKTVLGSIALDLFAVLLGGAVALLPVFASDILHVGPWGLGLLRSAPAIGASVTAVALAYHPIRRHAGWKMLGCVGAFGLGTIVFGLSTHFLLSLAALFTIGAADMVSVMVRHTLVQVATPASMRGRVSAVNLVFIGASNELGEFESGVTAAFFGPVTAVVIGGIGTCVVVALWAKLFPSLREVDSLESVAA